VAVKREKKLAVRTKDGHWTSYNCTTTVCVLILLYMCPRRKERDEIGGEDEGRPLDLIGHIYISMRTHPSFLILLYVSSPTPSGGLLVVTDPKRMLTYADVC
jgi:hypothetical protein